MAANRGAAKMPVALSDVALDNTSADNMYRLRRAMMYPVKVQAAYSGSVYGETKTAGVGARRYNDVAAIAMRRPATISVNLVVSFFPDPQVSSPRPT